MATKTSSVRIDNEELAKARDGLIESGIKPENLTSRSNILRMSVYLAIMYRENPDANASVESIKLLKSI